jgi:opacity protein-like surface antigen
LCPRLSERVQALIFVAILVAAIAGLYAAAQVLQPAAVPIASVRSVRLDIDGSGWSIHYAPERTTNNTAFDILLEASDELGFSVHYERYEIPNGVFVLGINGSGNGDGGRYWQYWVNGIYGSVAADRQGLHDGDAVAWMYAVPRERV